MTPYQLAKSNTESSHQIAFFAYCAVAAGHGFQQADFYSKVGFIEKNKSDPVEELKWIHHIPNGGSRGDTAKSRSIRGGKLKAEGVRVGVSDIFWPQPSGSYCGLYIEMKKPTEKPKKTTSKGGMSEEQIEFATFVTKGGYCFKVCYTWLEAVTCLKQYYGYVPETIDLFD